MTRLVEPMHLTVQGRKTACGLDLRGLRSTRQASVVTCKLCVYAVAEKLLGRPLRPRVPAIGGFVGVKSPFAKP